MIVPEVDPLTLDSIFPAPGRNDSCHCNSGKKYKKCCSSKDQEAWSAVAKMRREAEVASAMLPALPESEDDL